MGISYRSTLDGIDADALVGGFCEGWAEPMSPSEHFDVLAGSALFELAVASGTQQVVGYVTALTDGRRSSFVSFLEVLPAYRGRGIATALLDRILERLGRLADGRGVNVDLTCHETLVPFYERFGLVPTRAMSQRRNPSPSSP